jgi:hypothetical protein
MRVRTRSRSGCPLTGRPVGQELRQYSGGRPAQGKCDFHPAPPCATLVSVPLKLLHRPEVCPVSQPSPGIRIPPDTLVTSENEARNAGHCCPGCDTRAIPGQYKILRPKYYASCVQYVTIKKTTYWRVGAGPGPSGSVRSGVRSGPIGWTTHGSNRPKIARGFAR